MATAPRKDMRPKRKSQLSQSAEGILEELRALCLSLPETREKKSFGHPNFLAGKKAFVSFEQFNGRPSIAFRLDGDSIARLSSNSLFFDTPYGRGQWISMHVDTEFDWALVQELVLASYRLVALKRMIEALEPQARGSHSTT